MTISGRTATRTIKLSLFLHIRIIYQYFLEKKELNYMAYNKLFKRNFSLSRKKNPNRPNYPELIVSCRPASPSSFSHVYRWWPGPRPSRCAGGTRSSSPHSLYHARISYLEYKNFKICISINPPELWKIPKKC